MNFAFKCLLLSMIVATCYSSVSVQVTQNTILRQFMGKDTKTLYKVWHFINNKDYDYNTIQGLNKYKTFKANLKSINEHNAKNLSWTNGLNHLSDMTNAEIKEYYNLKPMSHKQFRNNMRATMNKGVSLDDYNDEDEVTEPIVQALPIVNWGKQMLAVRQQANCGSCWAFTTNAVLEGCWNSWSSHTRLTDHLSTQYPVDCDSGNGGCEGGWYIAALGFYEKHNAVYEAAYPYKAEQSNCQSITSGESPVRVTGVDEYDSSQPYWNTSTPAKMLARGPVAVAVDANDSWYAYSGGMFDGDCIASVNHAVTLIGYGKDSTGGYYIIRNSWGSSWGEAGHMNLRENPKNNNSCNIAQFSYQPKAFTA
jgi:C1A family cysteine protease